MGQCRGPRRWRWRPFWPCRPRVSAAKCDSDQLGGTRPTRGHIVVRGVLGDTIAARPSGLARALCLHWTRGPQRFDFPGLPPPPCVARCRLPGNASAQMQEPWCHLQEARRSSWQVEHMESVTFSSLAELITHLSTKGEETCAGRAIVCSTLFGRFTLSAPAGWGWGGMMMSRRAGCFALPPHLWHPLWPPGARHSGALSRAHQPPRREDSRRRFSFLAAGTAVRAGAVCALAGPLPS
jgi:hypothetical protein